MKVIFESAPDLDKKNPVVSVGSFDGVHLGHREIIRCVTDSAKKHSTESILVTFSPHPRKVVDGDGAPKMLTTLDEKVYLLEKMGIDNLFIINFTERFRELSYSDFLNQYIIEKLNAKVFVVGYDHHLGRNRHGNFDKVKMLGQENGLMVERVECRNFDSEEISSTLIRNYIKQGNITKANQLLGYDYLVFCKYYADRKCFVTEPDKLLPPDGIYRFKNLDNQQFGNLDIKQGRIFIDSSEECLKLSICGKI